MLCRRPAAEGHLPPGMEETFRKPSEKLWDKWGHAAPATSGRKTFATGSGGNSWKTFGKAIE